ncbi:hypothetical protein C8J57DRAFT_1543710 [Mycena rebaudengoi]|nr:hypothetical protein C8J57DRAFT_1543710 [Mycena rebaudengoi]
MQSCPSTNAPIQRLPTENLVHIFLFHAHTLGYKSDGRMHAVFRTEVERLANLLLLTLSQVCSRWHMIAIDTPIFWTKIVLNGVLWRTPSHLQTTVALLVSALKRGRDLPLILEITDDDNLPPHPRIFHLLASQSWRWASGIASEPPPLLKGTPGLRVLSVSSPLLGNISTINLQELIVFGCKALEPPDIARCMSLLSRLTPTAFHLAFAYDKWLINPNEPVDLHIAPQLRRYPRSPACLEMSIPNTRSKCSAKFSPA